MIMEHQPEEGLILFGSDTLEVLLTHTPCTCTVRIVCYIMALSSAAAAVKQGLLRHFRMPLQQACSSSNVGAGLSLSLWRGFAGGGYLDKDEVTQRVIDVAKHFEKIDPAKVVPGAHFEKDLGLDSLDVVELVMAFEEEFAVEIPDADADKIFTVDDAVNYIASHPMAK